MDRRFIVGVLLAAAARSPLAVKANVVIGIEAEQFAWTTPFKVASDPNALDGKYVLVPKGARPEGSGSTSVQLPSAGDYYLWVRVRAPSGADRWLTLEIGGRRYAWQMVSPTDWHWERVSSADRLDATKPAVVSVRTPGTYALTVLAGKDGIALNKVVITDDAYYVPLDHCHV